MGATTEDIAIKAWKDQFDTALRVIEAITEGSIKVRDAQLTAATEAHADAAATLELLHKASDPQALSRIQSDWLAASVEKSLGYWLALFTAVVETQASIARCISPQAQGVAPQAALPAEAPQWPVQQVMHSIYKPWLDTTQELLARAAASTAEKPRTGLAEPRA